MSCDRRSQRTRRTSPHCWSRRTCLPPIGGLTKALESATLAAEKHQDSAAAQFAVGRVQMGRKQLEPAIAAFDTVAVAANNLAWIYAQSDDRLDTALELAETAKRGLPDNAEVSATLGYVYYRKGMVDLALPAFQQSLAKDPSNPTYHYHLVSSRKGRQQSAGAPESLACSSAEARFRGRA